VQRHQGDGIFAVLFFILGRLVLIHQRDAFQETGERAPRILLFVGGQRVDDLLDILDALAAWPGSQKVRYSSSSMRSRLNRH
jgi:hypothetical protein